MQTNREWLYSLEPHELSEWFDAEHAETDVSSAIAYENSDSREKLEADVRDHFWHNDWCRTDMVLEWLDRQAAITERETIKSEYKALRKENDELRAKVKELTADLKDEGRTVNELSDENLALKAENALLLDANARLQRSLAETREKLGAAIDHAHAIVAAADLDEGWA